jgi:hypothetical protein
MKYMEINDKIICVDNNVYTDNLITYVPLTLYKIYIINDIRSDKFYFYDDNNKINGYYSHRFISLEEDRKIKLLELKERINESR